MKTIRKMTTATVAVGSTNPVKIEATRAAFEAAFPDTVFTVTGVSVSSEVSDQPMSDEETITGAKNRARKARLALSADFGVGLEGGIQKIGDIYFDCGWMVIEDTQGRAGIGSTIRMETPKKLMDLILQGTELGVANDIVFKQTNSKHGDGHFGLMTNNLITRTTGYRDGLFSALARFIQEGVFED